MNEGMQNLKEIEDLENQPLNRIADALEEILRLVKADQAKNVERMEQHIYQNQKANDD